MKLFRLFAQPNEYGCFDYDTYDSLVITADSEEQVDELLHNENFLMKELNTCGLRWSGNEHYQIKEIKLEEIKEPKIICASYNAG